MSTKKVEKAREIRRSKKKPHPLPTGKASGNAHQRRKALRKLTNSEKHSG